MNVVIWLVALFLNLSGCSNPPNNSQQNSVNQKKILEKQTKNQTLKPAQSVANKTMPSSQESLNEFKPFYIYADKGSRANHYIPSGFMPDGKCLKLNDNWVENCYSGQTCVRIDYDLECSRNDAQWAGIYWQNPANNWGKRKGGFNLTGAKKLTFWARGENGGEQIEEFIIGGIEGDYPDTTKVSIGPVILSKEWRQYTVDLTGKDLTYISGGFAWSTNEQVNPEKCIFYLDEMRFE